MSFTRQPLLNTEDETKLKEAMLPLWKKGTSGKDIASELKFGVRGSIFEKIKREYVFYFRQKFNDDEAESNKEFFGKFPPRRKAPFAKGTPRYKCGHPRELGLMPVNEFVETLNAKLPFYSDKSKMIRSYLILSYFTPLRSSELLERQIPDDKKSDFEITATEIILHLLRKKKKKNPRIKDEEISIRRSFPLVEEVVDYLQSKKWRYKLKKKHRRNPNEKINFFPFRFSKGSAWNYTQSIFKFHFPHFFRFNYISEEANQPSATFLKLVSKTQLSLQTLNKYLITNKKTATEVDDAREERYRKMGMI